MRVDRSLSARRFGARPTPDATLLLTVAAAGGAVALLGAGGTLGLLLVVAAGAAVAMLRRPPVALGLLAASIPVQDLVEASFGPIALRPTSAILLGLTVVWLARLVVERRVPRLVWTALPYAAVVGVVLASGLVARDAGEWVKESYRWIASLIVFLVALDTLRDPTASRPLLLGMAAGVIAVSILGIVQTIWAIGPPSYRVGGFTRAYGTFGAPNPLAGYLELTVPLLFAVAGGRQPARRGGAGTRVALTGQRAQPAPAAHLPLWLAAGCAIATGVGVLALILTQSRGGWLGGIASLGAVAYLTGGARWAALTLAGIVLLAMLTPPIGGRLATLVANVVGIASGEERVNDDDLATQERRAHWRAAVDMTRAQPLLGVGAGNFSARFSEFSPSPMFHTSRGHAHSNYLQAAAQTGLLGLGAYLALLATAALRLGQSLGRSGDLPRSLVIGAIGVTLALTLHGVVEYLHVLSLGLQIGLVWAMAEAGVERRQASIATVTA